MSLPVSRRKMQADRNVSLISLLHFACSCTTPGMAVDGFPRRLYHFDGIRPLCRRWFPYHEVGNACHGSLPDQICLQCLADHVMCLHDDRSLSAGLSSLRHRLALHSLQCRQPARGESPLALLRLQDLGFLGHYLYHPG